MSKLTGLTTWALVFAVIIFAIFIVGITTQNIRDAQLKRLRTSSLLDVSDPTNGTDVVLSQRWVNGITTVVNASTGITITPGNYTLSVNSIDGTGRITPSIAAADIIAAGEWNITYTVYNITDQSWQVANNGVNATQKFSNFFTIMGTVVAAIFVGVLVLGMRGGGLRFSGSSPGSY